MSSNKKKAKRKPNNSPNRNILTSKMINTNKNMRIHLWYTGSSRELSFITCGSFYSMHVHWSKAVAETFVTLFLSICWRTSESEACSENLAENIYVFKEVKGYNNSYLILFYCLNDTNIRRHCAEAESGYTSNMLSLQYFKIVLAMREATLEQRQCVISDIR